MNDIKYYCVYDDISQNYPLQIEEMNNPHEYCHGFVIEDDGKLRNKLQMAKRKLHEWCIRIEEEAKEKAMDPQPKWIRDEK